MKKRNPTQVKHFHQTALEKSLASRKEENQILNNEDQILLINSKLDIIKINAKESTDKIDKLLSLIKYLQEEVKEEEIELSKLGNVFDVYCEDLEVLNLRLKKYIYVR